MKYPCPAPPAGWFQSADAGGFVLILVSLAVVLGDANRLDLCYGAESSGSCGDPCWRNLDRQFLHLLPVRAVPVAELGAIQHGERHLEIRIRVGADDHEIRFAIAGHALAPAAAAAQVLVADRCSVLHVQLAHGIYFLIRQRRKVMAGEKTATA